MWLTKADTGNTLVIIQQDENNQKVDEFITQNNFTKVASNHINKQQKAIKPLLTHVTK
jgi:predicted DNA binding CopG/RHH family protein